MQEIVIGVSDTEAKVWENLFGASTRGVNGIHTFPRGPRLHLVPEKRPGIKTLILKVTSLRHVREIAEAENLEPITLDDRLKLGIPGGSWIEFVE